MADEKKAAPAAKTEVTGVSREEFDELKSLVMQLQSAMESVGTRVRHDGATAAVETFEVDEETGAPRLGPPVK